MKKHFRKLAIILSLALSVCSLAGCGKKEDAQKDTLTVAFRNEPANMDPTGSSSLTAFCIQFQNFDRLIINNGDGTYSPSLAKEWEQIDPLTYRFHLQEGVKFHDGSEMTADDVVYTIARAEKSTFSSSFFGYFNGEACKAVDKYTVDGLLKRWPDTKYRDWYLGDWLAPMGVDAGNQASVDLVSNCFISECLSTMYKTAITLGKREEAEEFAIRREKLNKLIHQTFYRADEGIYSTGSQLDMCYPMLVGVVPDSLYNKVKENVVAMTEEKYKGHIAVGLVGVPILTEWAVRNKQVDFFYQMMKKRDYPGYLYMIDHGATATWEYWSGERSRVHNCYNGIGTWFYQAVGGIRLDEAKPGYRHFYVDPQIPNGVTWAKVTKESPYGTIAVNWKLKDDNQLNLQLTVPAGTTATVCIPNNAVSCKKNKKKVSVKEQTVDVEAGHYDFLFNLK